MEEIARELVSLRETGAVTAASSGLLRKKALLGLQPAAIGLPSSTNLATLQPIKPLQLPMSQQSRGVPLLSSIGAEHHLLSSTATKNSTANDPSVLSAKASFLVTAVWQVATGSTPSEHADSFVFLTAMVSATLEGVCVKALGLLRAEAARAAAGGGEGEDQFTKRARELETTLCAAAAVLFRERLVGDLVGGGAGRNKMTAAERQQDDVVGDHVDFPATRKFDVLTGGNIEQGGGGGAADIKGNEDKENSEPQELRRTNHGEQAQALQDKQDSKDQNHDDSSDYTFLSGSDSGLAEREFLGNMWRQVEWKILHGARKLRAKIRKLFFFLAKSEKMLGKLHGDAARRVANDKKKLVRELGAEMKKGGSMMEAAPVAGGGDADVKAETDVVERKTKKKEDLIVVVEEKSVGGDRADDDGEKEMQTSAAGVDRGALKGPGNKKAKTTSAKWSKVGAAGAHLHQKTIENKQQLSAAAATTAAAQNKAEAPVPQVTAQNKLPVPPHPTARSSGEQENSTSNMCTARSHDSADSCRNSTGAEMETKASTGFGGQITQSLPQEVHQPVVREENYNVVRDISNCSVANSNAAFVSCVGTGTSSPGDASSADGRVSAVYPELDAPWDVSGGCADMESVLVGDEGQEMGSGGEGEAFLLQEPDRCSPGDHGQGDEDEEAVDGGLRSVGSCGGFASDGFASEEDEEASKASNSNSSSSKSNLFGPLSARTGDDDGCSENPLVVLGSARRPAPVSVVIADCRREETLTFLHRSSTSAEGATTSATTLGEPAATSTAILGVGAGVTVVSPAMVQQASPEQGPSGAKNPHKMASVLDPSVSSSVEDASTALEASSAASGVSPQEEPQEEASTAGTKMKTLTLEEEKIVAAGGTSTTCAEAVVGVGSEEVLALQEKKFGEDPAARVSSIVPACPESFSASTIPLYPRGTDVTSVMTTDLSSCLQPQQSPSPQKHKQYSRACQSPGSITSTPPLSRAGDHEKPAAGDVENALTSGVLRPRTVDLRETVQYPIGHQRPTTTSTDLVGAPLLTRGGGAAERAGSREKIVIRRYFRYPDYKLQQTETVVRDRLGGRGPEEKGQLQPQLVPAAHQRATRTTPIIVAAGRGGSCTGGSSSLVGGYANTNTSCTGTGAQLLPAAQLLPPRVAMPKLAFKRQPFQTTAETVCGTMAGSSSKGTKEQAGRGRAGGEKNDFGPKNATATAADEHRAQAASVATVAPPTLAATTTSPVHHVQPHGQQHRVGRGFQWQHFPDFRTMVAQAAATAAVEQDATVEKEIKTPSPRKSSNPSTTSCPRAEVEPEPGIPESGTRAPAHVRETQVLAEMAAARREQAQPQLSAAKYNEMYDKISHEIYSRIFQQGGRGKETSGSGVCAS